MQPCLTELSDANLLQILKADVRDEVNVFIPVLHQNLVVLTKTQVRQPVCQIGLKHTHRDAQTWAQCIKSVCADYKMQSGILLHVCLLVCVPPPKLNIFPFSTCLVHVRALQACGLAASLWKAAC